ncbi:methyl-accepting chemotaxis protein [Vibrio proteolyticus]|uniref:Methyl-accepting chemotaxis protein n=1 Tax=Vibrio proteolyticus NBRC 13287 TaxID=1219065 RepID=U3B6W2_VIBPR|nr:methyl-accepting chemotaxis protein [Vibrio proteolyticus]GAD65594.1 hypothetical protein VPR01S_01_03680 [Vibrio proteolyticus NBRC 13287]
MKRWFRQYPFHIIVSFVAGVPLLLTVALAIYLSSGFFATKEAANADREAVHLVMLYDNLAHNLAVERGLTAGVIGSQGKGEQVQALKKQRQVADLHIKALLSFQPEYLSPAYVNDLGQDVKSQLAQLNNVRGQVDQLQLSVSPFAYYSNINQLAIDNAGALLSKIHLSDMAQLGKSLVAVVTMKERAGQVRGALNGVFARGSSTESVYANINNYIQTGGYAERNARLSLPVDMMQSLNQAKQSKTWQEVEAVQQAFLNQSDTLDSVKGPAATQWFAMATERIKLINQVRNQIQQDMQTQADSQAQQASQMAWLTMLLCGVSAVLLSLLLMMSVSSLKARVGGLTRKLQVMSEERNLALQLDDQGKDEIAHISSSINRLNRTLGSLLSSVTEADQQSQQRLDQVVSRSVELGKSSEATTAKCTNIAASMTELAQSSNEIASSATRALEETESMTQQVMVCLSQSNSSFSNVEALAQQIGETQQCMQQLEQDAARVSSIVDTINGISEQTNLLALNAAIEAARAGEQGRGFAVVASEVRDLAQRSKEATEHISELLSKICDNTNRSVDNMRKSREASDNTFESVNTTKSSVSELEHVIELVNQHITSIANATEEQSKACHEVDLDVDTLTGIAEETGQLASALNQIVDGYRVDAARVESELTKFKLA